jgi:alpha-beta hydrolase superfamily lysophospholipase
MDKALQDIDHFVKQVKQESQTAQIPLFLWGHSMVFVLTMGL